MSDFVPAIQIELAQNSIMHHLTAPPASILSLPHEILLSILRQIDYMHKGSLVSLTLTCRRLRDLVNPELYRSILLDSKATATLLVTAFDINPTLQILVKSLVLSERLRMWSWDDGRVDLLRDVAARCTRLERLINNTSVDSSSAIQDSMVFAYTLRSLRHLACSANLLDFKRFSPDNSLETVSLRENTIRHNQLDPASVSTGRHIAFEIRDPAFGTNFRVLRHIHIERFTPLIGSAPWKLWKMFPSVKTFTMNSISLEEMQCLLDFGAGAIRSLEVGASNVGFFQMKLDVDQNTEIFYDPRPPSAKLFVDSYTDYTRCEPTRTDGQEIMFLRSLDICKSVIEVFGAENTLIGLTASVDCSTFLCREAFRHSGLFVVELIAEDETTARDVEWVKHVFQQARELCQEVQGHGLSKFGFGLRVEIELVLSPSEAYKWEKSILAANRDEFLSRPTLSSSFHDFSLSPTTHTNSPTDANRTLSGLDLEGGGTWIGVGLPPPSDTNGSIKLRFAALTNYTETIAATVPPRPSRGGLVSTFIEPTSFDRFPSLDSYLSKIDSEKEPYAGFNLLVGELGEDGEFKMGYVSNRDEVGGRVLPPSGKGKEKAEGPDEIFGLSNLTLDKDVKTGKRWPKVESGCAAFADAIKDFSTTPLAEETLFERLFGVLSTPNANPITNRLQLRHTVLVRPLFVNPKKPYVAPPPDSEVLIEGSGPATIQDPTDLSYLKDAEDLMEKEGKWYGTSLQTLVLIRRKEEGNGVKVTFVEREAYTLEDGKPVWSGNIKRFDFEV